MCSTSFAVRRVWDEVSLNSPEENIVLPGITIARSNASGKME
jgi:hypothetical protein